MLGKSLTFASVCVLLSLIGAGHGQSCGQSKVMFCYYSSWAVYRESLGNFTVNNIDTSLCSHYVFSFAGLGLDGTTIALDAFNDLPENGHLQQYYYFRKLKEQNPCIKVIISIGGWNEGSEKYSVMAENTASRAKFIDHLLRFLIYYGFDGVDLDWEYPGQRGGLASDKQNFVLLLKEMKERLGPRNKLISTAVGAGESMLSQSYDVKAISEIVDYVLLMTYDYNLENVTSHLAPLYRKAGDVHVGSVSESVQKWLDLGCPASKLVMGIQTSGRTYTLSSPNSKPENNGLGSAAKGPGNPGEFTNIPGFVSYYEACEMVHQTGWYVASNKDNYGSSYATFGDQWVTYEDETTVKVKAKYAADKKLAGLLVWTIDTDDFNSFCSKPENGLQRAMRSAFNFN